MDVIEACKRHINRAGDGTTHYEGCEEEHALCAMSNLVSLTEHLIGELMAADTRYEELAADKNAEVERLRATISRMCADGIQLPKEGGDAND